MNRLKILLAATACALPVLLSACSGGSAGASGSAVTIGYENNGSVDPAQAAMSLGLYQEYMHGKVKLVYFDSGPAALTALGSGDVDIMTGIGNPPVASAMATKVPLSVVWAEELGQTDQALIVKKDSGVSTVPDLAGKQVATVEGSTSAYALAAVLKKAGVAEKAVTVRNMDPQTLLTAWTKGQVSAAYIWHPVLGKLLAKDAVKIADNTDVVDTAPIYNLSIVNSDWAADNAGLVRQFIQAQDQGVEQLRANKAVTLAKMRKDTSETPAESRIAAASTKSFSAAHQLDPEALGPDDSHSLVRTSLLAASQYLNAIDPSKPVLKPSEITIDRSFVKAYLKKANG